LLVLDEATSALDADTEASLTSALKELQGSVTTLVIAHRLSTVQDADVVLFMESGRIIASGSFEDVRHMVPALERNAQLMGLETRAYKAASDSSQDSTSQRQPRSRQ